MKEIPPKHSAIFEKIGDGQVQLKEVVNLQGLKAEAGMTNERGVRNWGYDPTCSGWVVRDGTEHVATFRREVDADEYVRLLLAYIRAPEPKAPLACACIGCARKPKHGECECGMKCNCRCKLGPL